MKKTKLNDRFHNPNSAEDIAELLYKLMIEVNIEKVERAIRDAMNDNEESEYMEYESEKELKII